MKIWSVQQAAQAIGISERRVRTLLAEGRIKGQKLGHDWAILDLNYARRRKSKRGKAKDE